jgi:hypothetical protein
MIHRSIEVFAAVYFLAIGVSHVLHPHDWVDFFARLRDQGRSGMFAEGFLALSFGAIIVAFHDVRSGPAVGLTIIGWGQVLKGMARLLAPGLSLGAYRRVSHERAWQFRAAGALALGIAAYLIYILFRFPPRP